MGRRLVWLGWTRLLTMRVSPNTSRMLGAARADLLARAGHADAAGAAYQRAIGLASDDAVRRFLQLQLDRLAVYR